MAAPIVAFRKTSFATTGIISEISMTLSQKIEVAEQFFATKDFWEVLFKAKSAAVTFSSPGAAKFWSRITRFVWFYNSKLIIV